MRNACTSSSERVTIKQGIVYHLIVAAGPKGVSVEALSAGLFKGKAPVSIRVTKGSSVKTTWK